MYVQANQTSVFPLRHPAFLSCLWSSGAFGSLRTYCSTFGVAGARTEMSGCSLCMGNQARVEPGCTVVSTSTRNFPNRLRQGSNVYLASAELATILSIVGKLPTVDEYMSYMAKVESTAADTYRYLNFDELPEFVNASEKVEISDEMREAAKKLSIL